MGAFVSNANKSGFSFFNKSKNFLIDVFSAMASFQITSWPFSFSKVAADAGIIGKRKVGLLKN
jgi:hypothetical protein